MHSCSAPGGDAPSPVPTRLYGLRPGNFESGTVESLSGYLTRLAAAHCVPPTVLIDSLGREVAETDAHFSPLKNYGTRTQKFVNGLDKSAVAWVDALAEWTGVEGLHRCTLEWTSDVFAGYHLLASKPRYCPICLKEHEDGGTMPIDQLLWHVKCVKACPVHEVRLRERKCGAATKRPNLFARRSGTGHCADCGAISYRCDMSEILPATVAEVWVARQVQALLEHGATHRRLMRNDLVNGIKQLAINESDGKVAALARIANLSRSLLWELSKSSSTTRISLPALLQLASTFQVSLMSLLAGCPARSPDTPLVEFPKEIKRKIVIDDVYDFVLRMKADRNLPLSVTKLAGIFEVSRRSISDADPAFVKSLIEDYDTAKAFEKSEQDRQVGDDVEDVVMQLAARGQAITLRNAALISGKRWISVSKRGRTFKAVRKRFVPDAQGVLFAGEAQSRNR